MTTRREFLQAGIAVSAVPIAGVFGSDESHSLESAARLRTATVKLYKAVFDKRFPESTAFAVEMERLGVMAHGIAGDMTDLWYNDLHLQWIKTPVAIAGLTAHGPMFCLERLAWDHGMRVVFRAEHRYRTDGCLEHLITGEKSLLARAVDLQAGASDWGAQMARLATQCAPARPEAWPLIVTEHAPSQSKEQYPLFSWVIAPRARS